MHAALLTLTAAIILLVNRPPEASNVRIAIDIEGEPKSQLRCCDAIVRSLDQQGMVANRDNKRHAFLARRLWLFLSTEELDELVDGADARWDWEVAHAAGYSLDDGPPPSIDRRRRATTLRDRFERVRTIGTIVRRGGDWQLVRNAMNADSCKASDVTVRFRDDVFDRAPVDQELKIDRVHALVARILAARDRDIIDPFTWKKVSPYMPEEDLKPFVLSDIPRD